MSHISVCACPVRFIRKCNTLIILGITKAQKHSNTSWPQFRPLEFLELIPDPFNPDPKVRPIAAELAMRKYMKGGVLYRI